MASEQDLKAARIEFDEAFRKAALCAESPQLLHLQYETIYDLDEAPLDEQVGLLRDAAVKFYKFAADETDLSLFDPRPEINNRTQEA